MCGANKWFSVIRDFFIDITIPLLFFYFLHVILSVPDHYCKPFISTFNPLISGGNQKGHTYLNKPAAGGLFKYA